MIVFSVIFFYIHKSSNRRHSLSRFRVYSVCCRGLFFSNSLSFAIPSLVSNMNLVSKIFFPREILPLSSIFVCLIDYLISISIFNFAVYLVSNTNWMDGFACSICFVHTNCINFMASVYWLQRLMSFIVMFDLSFLWYCKCGCIYLQLFIRSA